MADKNSRSEWPRTMFSLLRDAGVELFCHVPDAGNDRLISLAKNDHSARVLPEHSGYVLRLNMNIDFIENFWKTNE